MQSLWIAFWGDMIGDPQSQCKTKSTSLRQLLVIRNEMMVNCWQLSQMRRSTAQQWRRRWTNLAATANGSPRSRFRNRDARSIFPTRAVIVRTHSAWYEQIGPRERRGPGGRLVRPLSTHPAGRCTRVPPPPRSARRLQCPTRTQ
jgi:hypothetical protein